MNTKQAGVWSTIRYNYTHPSPTVIEIYGNLCRLCLVNVHVYRLCRNAYSTCTYIINLTNIQLTE